MTAADHSRGEHVFTKAQCIKCHRYGERGEGIGPDLLPYIFDPFRQGHSSGTRIGGLGLGLYICRQIAEAHGGTLELRPRPGGGTEVALTLPRQDPAA